MAMGSSSSPKKEESLSWPGFEWVRGRLLGKGGFGSVHLGWVENPNMFADAFPTPFAVKSTSYYDSLELGWESSLLNKFSDCPFVIHLYGDDLTAGADGDVIYNVFMEYADGGTIGDLINKSMGYGMPAFHVSKYTKSILKGLKYIHEMGYVHCDLKPDNILLVSNGSEFVPKIGDFGLSKRAEEKGSSRFRAATIYLSPETVLQDIQEQPSDIWSLGCVVRKMLTGKQPWDLKAGATTSDFVDLIASESPTIPYWLSEEATDFLEKCFVKNPSERCTAAELLNHPFVTRQKLVKEVFSVPSSSEKIEEQLGPSHSDSEQQILPLPIRYPRDSRPVIPNSATVSQKPSALPIAGAA